MLRRRQLWKASLCCIGMTLFLSIAYFVATQEPDLVDTFDPFDPDVPSPAQQNNHKIKHISKYKIPVRGEHNIIFLETTCVTNPHIYPILESKIVLTLQQICAIESAAKVHRNASVYLFYSCAMDTGSINRSSQVVREVFSYPNVYIWHQSMDSVFEGTPLVEFYRSGQMRRSFWPIPHSSDVLRTLMLWKYGGIYLDLDFIVLRPFDSLGANFAGIESSDNFNSAAMRLSVNDDIGRRILDECVEELRTNFNGRIWGHNGPLLLTRVIRKRCGGIWEPSKMTLEACKGFLVLPQYAFYNLAYHWQLFFDEGNSSKIMEDIKKGYALHLWHSMMTHEGGHDIDPDSKQPIALLEQEYCPIVHSHTKVGPYIPLEVNNGKDFSAHSKTLQFISLAFLVSTYCWM